MIDAYILTSDRAFGQFVRLTLSHHLHGVELLSPTEVPPPANYYIVDLDTVPMPQNLRGQVLCCSAYQDKPCGCEFLWLMRPFRPKRLLAVLGLIDDPIRLPLYPLTDRESVMVEGEEVALTHREYALFMALWNAGGGYVKREDLLLQVWGEDSEDMSVVNVYIHYLKGKLERSGRVCLRSKRNVGYALVKGDS